MRTVSAPIKGLRKRVAFRLPSAQSDPSGNLRFIRVPVGDRYASAGCSISDIDLFVMLAEIGDDTIEGNIYELVIWAAKPTRKTTVFSRTAEVLPSENNILLWERVISSISAELVATLNAGEVVWEDVGSPSPAT